GPRSDPESAARPRPAATLPHGERLPGRSRRRSSAHRFAELRGSRPGLAPRAEAQARDPDRPDAARPAPASVAIEEEPHNGPLDHSLPGPPGLVEDSQGDHKPVDEGVEGEPFRGPGPGRPPPAPQVPPALGFPRVPFALLEFGLGPVPAAPEPLP